MEGVQLACSADSRLYLVADHKNISLGAERRERLYVIFIEDIHSALALNNFEHHGAGFVRYRFLQGIDVIRLNKLKAAGKREEIVVKNILTRSGKGSYRSAVEGVAQCDNLISALAVFIKAVFAGDFYSALVSLGSAVAEADL